MLQNSSLRKIGIIFFGYAFLLFGCGEERFGSKLNKTLTKNLGEETLESIDYLIIIPNAGCPGCITSAEDLFLRYGRQTDIQFIFTKFVSLKNLKLKLGLDSDFDSENVFFDRVGVFTFGELESIYPAIIYLGSDKKHLKLEFISPTNPNAIANFLNVYEN